MANFMTIAVDCQHEGVRRIFEEILAGHREFLLRSPRQAGRADLVILELDTANPQRTFSVIRTTLAAAPGTEIALTAERIDSQVMLEAVRLGVKEFFLQPLNRQELDQALGRFKARFRDRAPTSDTQAGTVVSVLGAKAGVGVSTIAVNVAISVQQIARQRSVALMDINVPNSDLASLLDLTPAGGLRDLAQDLSRLDETILLTALTKHASGVHLLASGVDTVCGETFPPRSVLHTLDLMRSVFEYVIVDCGAMPDPLTQEALALSTAMLVVTTLEVPAIRRAKRMLDFLRATEDDTPGRISLVVNRYTAKQQDLLREAEEVLQQKAAWLIRNDYAVASAARDQGTPVVTLAPRADLSKTYQAQAKTLLQRSGGAGRLVGDAQNRQQNRSLLARYWPGFSASARAKPETT